MKFSHLLSVMGALAQATDVEVNAQGVVPAQAEVADMAAEDADMMKAQPSEGPDMNAEEALETVKKMSAEATTDLGNNHWTPCHGEWGHQRMITLAKKIDAWQKHGQIQKAMDKSVYMNKPLIQ